MTKAPIKLGRIIRLLLASYGAHIGSAILLALSLAVYDGLAASSELLVNYLSFGWLVSVPAFFCVFRRFLS